MWRSAATSAGCCLGMKNAKASSKQARTCSASSSSSEEGVACGGAEDLVPDLAARGDGVFDSFTPLLAARRTL
uniref:Uncharacterized protein n=1 Tax=Arundo donax TaxID=35708 RepID=A0A0A9CBU4_ARUDO